MKYHLAVLDVGKTNKKVLIYDQELKLVDSEFKVFPEKTSAGIIFDDVEGLWDWFKDVLKKFATKFDIRAISVSTHGATFTCLDEEGELAVPEISYTTDPGPQFQHDFFQRFGDPVQLQQETCTPNFDALINVAKGIWFVKKKYPDGFYRVKHILNYPQFFGFKLTGIAAAEPTYIGCHTYLWDFEKQNYSALADKLGVRELLPQRIGKPWEVLGSISASIAKETRLSPETVVTFGIHDSNASLLPYLIQGEEKFVLNSTGTWCVVMKESEQVNFANDELGKIVFYNLSAFSKPVKTAIFLGGLEFDSYFKILKQINQRDDYPPFNLELYQQVISDADSFIMPSITKGTGQFPDAEPRVIEGDRICKYQQVETGEMVPPFFNNYEKAYAVLNVSLAIQTKVALQRAGIEPGMPVFVEGGFRKNEAYNKLLTAFFPDSEIFTTNLEEATAFGAALLAKAALESADPSELKNFFQIDKQKVTGIRVENLSQYEARFMEQL